MLETPSDCMNELKSARIIFTCLSLETTEAFLKREKKEKCRKSKGKMTMVGVACTQRDLS